MIFAVLATVLVSAAAHADMGRGDRDDRRGDRGDRVTCTIYTGRGPAFGDGRDCLEAIDEARRNCTMIARHDKKCFNAGNRAGADFQVRCSAGPQNYAVRCTPF